MSCHTSRVYLSPPHVFGQERDLLLDAFDSNWIAPLGPHVDMFEREVAAAADRQHAVALSSGTAALQIALRLAGIGPGDRVAVSTLTFVATANAVLYLGAEPLFIDCHPSDWNMDPDLLETALRRYQGTERPIRAVIVVDVFGQCAPYDLLEPLCNQYDVPIISDCAESLGASRYNRPAGSFGLVGCFSFNGNKIITTSGGGMLVTDDARQAEKARFWATQARDPAPHYEHSELGYNFRMSNLLAAVGRGQLEGLQQRVAARRANFVRYRERLQSLPGIRMMPEPAECKSSRWLTCITVDESEFGKSPEAIRLALEAQNIESRPLWKPMHMQPLYAKKPAYGGCVSETLFTSGLCLPSGSNLSADQLDRVCDVIEKVCKE